MRTYRYVRCNGYTLAPATSTIDALICLNCPSGNQAPTLNLNRPAPIKKQETKTLFEILCFLVCQFNAGTLLC